MESLPELSFINGDLKDVQRPWVAHTILHNIPVGAKCLEIGGGDPHVADFLTKKGYRVTVIDPYDGRHGGPSDMSEFVVGYPDITFIRGEFPSGTQHIKDESFDCVYSVSVLEHVPGQVASTFHREIKRLLKTGGFNIHAIDHVTMGNGADFHYENLVQWAAGFDITHASVDSILTKSNADADCYFLSAEAHNKWRGHLSYSQFPMRRVIGINVLTRPTL